MAIEKRAARRTKEDKSKLNHLLEIGMISPDKPGKKKTTYSVRLIPENTFENITYPGFNDHPSTQEGIEYSKQIDQTPTGSIWTGLVNMIYAEGGIPLWIREATSDLDISVYWQMAHYQFVNDGTARMSVRTLSRSLARPYRSIQRCIARLLEVGLVVKVRKNSGRTPSAYRVLPPSSIQPKTISKRRIDSGFDELLPSVEVTAGSVEVTAQTRRGDRADTQKTKPLQGESADGRSAGARPVTVSRKNNPMTMTQIPTIDNSKKKSKVERNRVTYSNRPHIIRTFHDIEVNPKILTTLLNNVPTLLTLFNECVDTNTRF